jgi:hypothetical protein
MAWLSVAAGDALRVEMKFMYSASTICQAVISAMAEIQ